MSRVGVRVGHTTACVQMLPLSKASIYKGEGNRNISDGRSTTYESSSRSGATTNCTNGRGKGETWMEILLRRILFASPQQSYHCHRRRLD